MNIINWGKYVLWYLRGTRAVAAMEYAIVVGVVLVGVGAALTTFNTQVTALIARASTVVQGLIPG